MDMNFILGIIFGMFVLSFIKSAYNKYITYKGLVKPIDKYIDAKISDYTFVERRASLVKIEYSTDCYILITINTVSISIFIDDELSIYTIDDNKKKMQYLLDRLLNGFYDEIYTNVVEVGGNVFSENLVTFIDDNDDDIADETDIEYKVSSYIPTVDDILDKINRSGIDSLTKRELNILGKE